jgi:proline iminopeptidase
MVELPVVVALHGGPGGDHSSFKPVLSGLVGRAQVVYVDHRGCGRSARGPQETYTLENNVEDLEALRQHLGLPRIAVLGISYGGMVALAYAARYPAAVSHLIVACTAASHRFLDDARANLAAAGTPEQQHVAERLWDGSFEDEEQLVEYFEVLGPLYARRFDLEVARSRRGRRIYSPEAINEGFGGFLRTYDLTTQLPHITASTLVVAGRHDWICPPHLAEEIAAGIDGADLRIFEHTSHQVLVDEPQAFIDLVRGFLVYR